MPDFLLVADDVGQVLGRLSAALTVTQHLPPRLAIVRAARDAVDVLAAAPGVLGIGEPDLPPAVRQQLTASEQLFVDAWAAGRRPKGRTGDGLAWDAPGFLPPDPPPGR